MKPLLQALLLADHVYADAVTGKKIVAGIFHRILVRKHLPQELKETSGESQVTIHVKPEGHQAGSPFCYVSLTEVRGDQHFRLRFVDLKDDSVLLDGGFSVNASNPLETIEAVIPLPMLPVTKAGTFALELLLGNEPIGSHRINVVEVPEEKESDGA